MRQEGTDPGLEMAGILFPRKSFLSVKLWRPGICCYMIYGKSQEWSPGRQLWIMDLEDGEGIPLTAAVDYHHTSISWHPGDTKLAYVRLAGTPVIQNWHMCVITRPNFLILRKSG